MTTETTQHTTSEFVKIPLKYLASDKNPVGYIASVGGGDTTRHDGDYIMQPTSIYNGRDKSFSLDREGFALVKQSTQVENFYDDGEIEKIYEDEVKSLILKETGASRVEIFDHTRRSSSQSVQKEKQIRETASIIHNDYTARSGPKRLRDHFADTPDQVEALLDQRFAIINVWRSIRGTVINAPLAFCDASSVLPEDLVSVKRQAKDRIGEIQQAIYKPAHRWYYFPEMEPDEAVLIKTYDSETDGRARFTIHTSFEDPSIVDAPPRESIETRCFVFF